MELDISWLWVVEVAVKTTFCLFTKSPIAVKLVLFSTSGEFDIWLSLNNL